MDEFLFIPDVWKKIGAGEKIAGIYNMKIHEK